MIGKIAVSSAIYGIDKPYDYRIPGDLRVLPGQRVMVPFGRGDKQVEGIVLQITEGDESGLKSVLSLLDEEPLLDEKLLRLAAFMRERYFCTFYDAIKAILPAGVWFRSKETYVIADAQWREKIHRQPVALAVMETISDLGGQADATLLRKQFEEEALSKALHYLLGKKLLTGEVTRQRGVRDKVEQIAVLTVTVEEALQYAADKKRSAPLQSSVLEMLASFGACARKDLVYYTGATGTVLRRLEELGYITLMEEEQLRLPHVQPAELEGELILNPEQQTVYDALKEQQEGVSLLYGVTGSGKTSVYIKLIYDCLERGRSAILLVPEIALTPQLLSLFAAHFQDRVAVLHSSLRLTERYDTWKKIRRGEARVILGTRSAIFAPVQAPGLIILDEEQEHTYKSEQAPRYHAREIAIYRGVQEGIPVILGSATPSVESMYRAEQGIYRLYTLKHRYNKQELPPVEIVDMKQELRNGNGTPISEDLYLALRENIRLGQQSILFLNRRGTSSMLSCISCGHVPDCPGCDLHLTYHHANGRLMCHYCGYSAPAPRRCPQCGGAYKQIGVGTQKIQERLTEMFGQDSVLRMDADTVSAMNTHEKLLSRFREEKIPILLGTQMVAKGLNFENVTLVGVLDGDMSLYIGDYRAGENTFSMITQVIGRAGRGQIGGRAVIQTMTPENPVIRLAAQQDYDSFYRMEIAMRELRECPPFFDQFTLTFHGREEQKVRQGTISFRDLLMTNLNSEYYREQKVRILGPAPAQIPRVNFVYRYRLTLLCKNTRILRQLLSHLMREFKKDKANRDVGVYADVNGNE